jgi:hypothetical protein
MRVTKEGTTMLKLQFQGLAPDTNLLRDVYQAADEIYDALPCDSDLNVTLAQEISGKFYRCTVKFNSLWGHGEVRESWVRPKEALKAAAITINEEIKKMRGALL